MTMEVRILHKYESESYNLPEFFVPKMKEFVDANFVNGKDYTNWSTCTHFCYSGSKKIEMLVTLIEFHNQEAMNLFLTVYGDYYERYEKSRW